MTKHDWVEVRAGVQWCRRCGAIRAWHAGKFYWQRYNPNGKTCTSNASLERQEPRT
jgi:hypothetical protein